MRNTAARPALTMVVRGWWARHPETLAIALVIAAWGVLVVDHFAHHGDTSLGSWRFETMHWSAMVVAMMVPGIVPALRRVAFDSLWSRRHRAMSLFGATFCGIWVAVGVAGWIVLRSAEWFSGATVSPGRAAVVVALVLAGGWQFAPGKRRSLARCHRRRSLAPVGHKADWSAVRYGAAHARACIGTCGPMMGAMFVSSHDVHLMMPLTAITLFERFQTRPNPTVGAIIVWSMAMIETATAF